jgi:hypothetical protein
MALFWRVKKELANLKFDADPYCAFRQATAPISTFFLIDYPPKYKND